MALEKGPSELVVRTHGKHITTLSKPFSVFNVMKVGGRATLVQLLTGAVAVFSPVPLTEEIKQIVADLGPIKYIIALNHEHYLYVAEWKTAYPESVLIGPAGLQEKRFTTKKQQQEPNSPSQTFDVVIQPIVDNVISDEFHSEFDVEFVWAHFNKELVFNHKPSKMLIEGDLWFNMPATEQYSKSDESAESGIVTRLGTKLHQSGGDSTVRRLMWYFFCMGKKEEFGEQVRRIASWDFEGIIPCHGGIVEEGGKQVFEEVLTRYM